MRGSQFFCTGCGHRLLAGKRFCTNCGKEGRGVAPSSSPGLPPGMVMAGRWVVGRQLGKGGMGAVYLVSDARLANRRAALKEMLDQSLTLGDREAAVERFNREAETLAGLSHPHVPHIYDRFAQADRIYMVMEYVDGLDLEKLLEQFGRPLPERVVARYAYQLCSVLDYLHHQEPPTLHRDLKPSNIILQASGLIKLIDFGIAKLFSPGSQGTGLGTQGYAAPEQYRGLAEPRTDLYALGATLHHLLTGRNPQLETPFDFPPLQVAAGLDELVMAMLEMRAENRPGSAAEVRRRLAELYEGIHDWPEDPQILQLVGGRPRRATRQLGTAPPAAPPPGVPVAGPGAVPQATPPGVPVAQPSPMTPPGVPVAPPAWAPAAPPPAAAQAPGCGHCGRPLVEGGRFCVGCGAPSPPRVPKELAGSQPLELLAFDDEGPPYCLLGVVELGGAEYAFLSVGPQVTGGSLVEVYVFRGEDHLEPVALTPALAAAWRSLIE